jgi:hypothetical protein
MYAAFLPARHRPRGRNVLLIATALTAAWISSGYAADVTISTHQTNTVILNQLLPAGGSVDILTGVTLARGLGTQVNGPSFTLSNAGTISANPTPTGGGFTPVFMGNGGTLTNSGIINSGIGDFDSVEIVRGSGNNTFTNSGTVRGSINMSSVFNNVVGGTQAQSFTNTATGVLEAGIDMSGGTSNTVTNAGRITGSILLGQDNIGGDIPLATDPIVIAPIKTVTNTATGNITGAVVLGGAYVRTTALPGSSARLDVFSQGTFTNAGTVTLSFAGGSGLVIADTINNSGTITGAAEAIAVISYGDTTQATSALSSLSGTLNNSGTITGDIAVRTIVNSGTINGNLLYGANNGVLLPTDNPAFIGGLTSSRAAVTGSLNNSGTLNGRISLASGSVSNSGTIRFGTAIGTSTIGGNYTQTSTGTLVVKVNDAGQSDKLTVGGQALLQGGTLSVAAADGAWNVNRTYSILTAAGGVSGTFSNLNITLPYLTPSLTYSANEVSLIVARQTADIQAAVVAETTEQQVSTSARQVSQSIDARVDQAISMAFMGLPTQDRTSFAPGVVTGLSAGDSTSALWGSWATFSPTFLKQTVILPGSGAAQNVKGTSLSFLAGADRSVGQRFIVGAFFSYESSDFDIVSSAGGRDGKGPLAGIYAGALLTDWAYASVQLNHAWLDNSVAEGAFGVTPVTGDFNSRRVMFSSTLTAYKVFEEVKLSGKLAYAYSRETFSGYRASDGATVTPTPTRLGRVSTGIELLGTGQTFLPYASATYEWDVDTTGVSDREGAIFGVGMRYLTGMWSFDLYGNTQVGRVRERSNSIGINARYSF